MEINEEAGLEDIAAVDDIEEVEEIEESDDDLEGVALIAGMFTPNQDGTVFIPKPNIADMFDKDTLSKVGRQVKEGQEADWDSMSDWVDLVEFGLDLVKQETSSKSTPWEGAANFKSPELMNAALKFSDRASTELLRDYNILKTKVIGSDPNNLKFDQGQRVSEFTNWQLNVEMVEWRDEHEKMIYDLPYTGTVFKKTFFDQQLGRNMSTLITYPNFAVSQDADSIARLPRFSEKHDFSENEVLEKQAQGLWLDIDLDLGSLEGDDDTQAESGNYTTFIEQQGYYDLDGDGYEEPYTFVVQESNGVVVRIMPRFEPKDVLVKDEGNSRATTLDRLMPSGVLADGGDREVVRIKADDNVTKYGFIRDPQGGFLDVGYAHLLSAMVSGINTGTNQLIDAGTLSNRQSGWLSKEFRRKMGASSFRPGEWKQTGVSAINLQQGVVPLPVKEPSPTLFALMQFLTSGVQELAASTDLKGALGANAPVGTTLALIDEQLQGTGAIVNRIYRAMSSEFRKLTALNAVFVDPLQYQEILDEPQANFEQDFNIRGMAIVPVANPEISTKTQRVVMAQAELSQVLPLLQMGKDPTPIIRNFFEVIGSNITDELFPEETPDVILQRLLSENPDLQDLVMGEAERLDLIAAAQADAEERLQAREDAALASKLDKEASEVKKNEATTIKTLEEAETENLKNDVTTYITAVQLDNQELQNQQIAQQLQQPTEVNNAVNTSRPTGLEQ